MKEGLCTVMEALWVRTSQAPMIAREASMTLVLRYTELNSTSGRSELEEGSGNGELTSQPSSENSLTQSATSSLDIAR